MNETLKPVRTREDCFSWVTNEQLELELFAAFRGARKYYEDYDFSSDLDDGFDKLIEGTILAESDGLPVASRETFLHLFLMFFVWRVRALSERSGVDFSDGDLGLPMGMNTALEAIKTSAWHPWLNASVKQVTITAEQFKSLPPDVQMVMRKIAKSGKPFIEKL